MNGHATGYGIGFHDTGYDSQMERSEGKHGASLLGQKCIVTAFCKPLELGNLDSGEEIKLLAFITILLTGSLVPEDDSGPGKGKKKRVWI